MDLDNVGTLLDVLHSIDERNSPHKLLQCALNRIAAAIPCDYSLAFVLSGSPAPAATPRVAKDLDPKALDQYTTHYRMVDPARGLLGAPGGITKKLDWDRIPSCEFTVDFLGPLKTRRSLAMVERHIGNHFYGVGLSLHRSGHFSDKEAQFLSLLSPHLGNFVRAIWTSASDLPIEFADPVIKLTPRERQVALLAAERMTSQEIAERLVVSPRTVDKHLEHIFDKFGFSSRRELTRLFVPGLRPQDF